MERFDTLKKLIVAPALEIALTAGSAMAGPRHHFGGADCLGGAMSDHIASRPDAYHLADHEFQFGHSELGATREVYPPINKDVMAKYIYSPTEVAYFKQLLSQR
ncbi:hypothetical protein RUE5091_03320 [Ruegeria denitrificans]|uniref:Uncharacterized protein n=1 Tax=Ruegeria denitrificans TaxID=1715692 RepID=A0A0P1IFQ6_9RHOB|nr:hypothetical protein [Ruegeria denitrificans]CUK10495.1 hypothetical protein RUE5091_03320 [Ruegeria denitrificans]